MARKTKAEALETRNLILDAAERVFGERGVARTSLHEIARSAGLTRGAVYWHFQGKYDLLSALWQRVLLPLDEAFAAIDAELGDDPVARIRAKTARVAHRIVHDPRTQNMMGIALLRCEMVDEIAAAKAQILQERDDCRAKMAAEFVHAVELGQLRKDVEPRSAAIGLHGLIDGLSYHWLLDPGHFDLEQQSSACVDAWLVGLGAKLPAAARSRTPRQRRPAARLGSSRRAARKG